MEVKWSILRMNSKENGTVVNAIAQVSVTIEGESSNAIINYVHNNDALVEDYIPFDELTEGQIIEWVKESTNGGEEAIAKAVENISHIAERKSKRKLLIKKLPWRSKTIKSTQGDVNHT